MKVIFRDCTILFNFQSIQYVLIEGLVWSLFREPQKKNPYHHGAYVAVLIYICWQSCPRNAVKCFV